MGSLSAHFSQSEFNCKCGLCDPVKPDAKLIIGLEDLREEIALLKGHEIPIHVNSGYRCKRHNANVGGSPNSQHVLGKAADIHVVGFSARELYKLAIKIPAFIEGGIGVYVDQGFIHLDTGPARRWVYLRGKRYGVDILSTLGD
jgi:uncharacterized protein YcbK (DUF882 family)